MCRERFERVLRPAGSGDCVARAVEHEEIIDEASRSRDVERIRPHGEENAWRLRTLAALFLERLRDAWRIRTAERSGEVPHRALDLREMIGRDHHPRNVRR